MVSNESLSQTLEHFRQQKQRKMEELKSLDFTIRQLERELGESGTEATSDLKSMELNPVVANGVTQSPQTQTDIRPDEFFGKSQSDAAKAYLRRIRMAVSIEQLVEGMKRGGAQVGGADPRRTLYVSLMRNPKKEFIVVGEGFIGLREFYPHLPKSGTPRGQKSKPPKKRKKRSAQTPQRGVENPKEKADSEGLAARSEAAHKETQEAVLKVLRDGQLHMRKTVHEAVEKELGRKIASLSVYGILRNKKIYEEVDGQVRLKK